MVFYNIRYILNKILYIIKWSILALLTILFIIICLYIMSTSSHAETVSGAYERLEYIQANGTQYIDTGYLPSANII